MNNKINNLLLATEMMKMKLREVSDNKKLVFEDDDRDEIIFKDEEKIIRGES